MSSSDVSKTVQEIEIEQKHLELKEVMRSSQLTRIKTSQAIADLMKYVEEHQDDDHLITGFDEDSKKNPYKRERLNKCIMM